MPMTIVVTRNVSLRMRGFLASCMCEIAPGVYTAPRLNKAARERIWQVLTEWFEWEEDDAGIVMTWPDSKQRGGQTVWVLGGPKIQLLELDEIYLARRDLSAKDEQTLFDNQIEHDKLRE